MNFQKQRPNENYNMNVTNSNLLRKFTTHFVTMEISRVDEEWLLW